MCRLATILVAAVGLAAVVVVAIAYDRGPQRTKLERAEIGVCTRRVLLQGAPTVEAAKWHFRRCLRERYQWDDARAEREVQLLRVVAPGERCPWSADEGTSPCLVLTPIPAARLPRNAVPTRRP